MADWKALVAGHRRPVLDVPRGHIRALQGVRGVAVLLVVLSHCLPRSFETDALGIVGVTMFFTLSGFLITGVLIGTRRERYRHLGAFYGARAVRLLPALLILVVSVGTVWTLQGRSVATFAGYAATAVFYVENFFSGQHGQTVLAHTWSLSVEEQFYILWPVLLVPILALRPLLRVVALAVLVLASLAARVLLMHHGFVAQAFDGTAANAYALFLGCLLRLVPITRLLRPWMAWVGLIGVGMVILGATRLPNAYVTVGAVAAVATVLVIAGSLDGNALLARRPLVFLGSVSYAWYLWHWPALWLTGSLHSGFVSFLAVAGALGLACLSTFLVEGPVGRRYRSWLGRSAPQRALLPASARGDRSGTCDRSRAAMRPLRRSGRGSSSSQ